MVEQEEIDNNIEYAGNKVKQPTKKLQLVMQYFAKSLYKHRVVGNSVITRGI